LSRLVPSPRRGGHRAGTLIFFLLFASCVGPPSSCDRRVPKPRRLPQETRGGHGLSPKARCRAKLAPRQPGHQTGQQALAPTRPVGHSHITCKSLQDINVGRTVLAEHTGSSFHPAQWIGRCERKKLNDWAPPRRELFSWAPVERASQGRDFFVRHRSAIWAARRACRLTSTRDAEGRYGGQPPPQKKWDQLPMLYDRFSAPQRPGRRRVVTSIRFGTNYPVGSWEGLTEIWFAFPPAWLQDISFGFRSS